MSSSIINIKGLCKSYVSKFEHVDVLKHLDLEICSGDKIAIIGSSGSGKSTLLNLLGGLDQNQEGLIEVEGRCLSQYSDFELAEYRKKKIGFVFQFHYLLMDFTVLENVMIPAQIRQSEKAYTLEERAMQLLENLGLDGKEDRLPTELSGGEQQRVAIARALINQPDLLLADEPTGNLDEENRNHVLDLLLDIADKRGAQSMIIVTHDLEIAKKMDRIYVLKNGILTNIETI